MIKKVFKMLLWMAVLLVGHGPSGHGAGATVVHVKVRQRSDVHGPCTGPDA